MGRLTRDRREFDECEPGKKLCRLQNAGFYVAYSTSSQEAPDESLYSKIVCGNGSCGHGFSNVRRYGANLGRSHRYRETDEVTLDSKGDATLSGTPIFPSEGSYSEVKSNYPDPNLLLRSLLGSSGKDAITDAAVKYDDDKKAIVLNETVLGSAVVRRNHWQAFGRGGRTSGIDLYRQSKVHPDEG